MNNQYGFYTSWSDLFGVRTERVDHPDQRRSPGQALAALQVLTVPGRSAGDHARKILVWLPPEYRQPQFHSAKPSRC